MTDCDAMLAAILSDPADDHSRLLFADHLDECGEGERAEFVRVQVELAMVRCKRGGANRCDSDSYCRYCMDREPLLARDLELRRDHGTYWMGEVFVEMCLRTGTSLAVTWQRGFVASIRLSWDDWLRHHEALYWNPKQTAECPKCGGVGLLEMMLGQYAYPPSTASTPVPCKQCGGKMDIANNRIVVNAGSGRIPRPFVATAHPITRAELTTWPCEPMAGINASAIGAREHTFIRVKCPECKSAIVCVPPCDKCKGQPLNEWHCDQWPTVTFVMPDSR